ncbi:MAG: carbamate kinase [Anaerovoracaceae bacterium]|jgi:carbamate kinase
MGKGKIVIALGGNALQSGKESATAEAQLKTVHKTCEEIIKIVKEGYQIVLAHGNGPQVGRILLASETAGHVTPVMPFDVCGAMSQGYIGYHIQQGMGDAIRRHLKEAIPVVTVVTQVVVSREDPGFKNPTKPIGPFYDEEEAKQIAYEKGYTMREDSGRGWRRVVASPIPKRIVEIDIVRSLWKEAIVIAAGGGGVPVAEDKDGSLIGVEAVIDKDFAAGLMAEELNADVLLILTEVEKAAINFGKADETSLSLITVREAENYIKEGHFAPGSMLPKIEAAVRFAKSGEGRRAIITSLYSGVRALKGETGTIIIG